MNDLQQLYQELIAENFSPEEALAMVSQITGRTISTNDAISTATTAGLGTKAKSLFANLRGKFGEGKTVGPKALDLSKLKTLGNDIRGTNVMGLGTVSGLANTGMGIYQGINALKNANELSSIDSDLNNLTGDIKSSAYANPMAMSYLNADQKRLFRQLQNDTYNTTSEALGQGTAGAVKSLPKAILSGLGGGLIGGPLGALIGAGGTLLNSGLQGAAQGKQNKQAELEALYQTLFDAENDYNAMRRPANVNYAGLQRRYSNVLM